MYDLNLRNRKNRIELPARPGVYWLTVSRGAFLGYLKRTSDSSGEWQARVALPRDEWEGKYRPRMQVRLGTADDLLKADNAGVLSYEQALEKARVWFANATTALRQRTGDDPIEVDSSTSRRRFTVKDAIDHYLPYAKSKARTLQSYERTRSVTKNILRNDLKLDDKPIGCLSDVPVEKLTRKRLERWLHALAETRRRKAAHGLESDDPEAIRRARDTANRQMTVLKAALNYAQAEEKVTCDDRAWRLLRPFENVGAARVRFLSDDEAQRLVEACPHDFGLVVRGLLYSGVRYGELCRLQCGDVADGTLYVQMSKSGKPRHVHLDPEAATFFESLVGGRRATEPLFLTRRGHKRTIPRKTLPSGKKAPLPLHPWTVTNTQRLMQDACKAAGILACSLHELRHSAASRWLRRGLSLSEVSQQLGHSDVRMVDKHYGHLCQNTLRAKLRGMTPWNLPPVSSAPEAKPEVTVQ